MKIVKTPKSKCGGRKGGCSLAKSKKQWEFPYFVEDSIKIAA